MKNERWIELGKLAAAEPDSKKLLERITEINCLLAAKKLQQQFAPFTFPLLRG
jgi:hypothetical protein